MRDNYKFTDEEWEMFLNGVEIWRDVPGWDGKYMVSTFGRVKCFSKCGENIKIPQNNGNGYFYIQFMYDGKVKNNYIHRLVAECFIDNKENKPQINHIDFNRSNNKLSNIEWVSIKENVYHSTINNRFKNANKKQSDVLKNKYKNGTNPFCNLSLDSILKARKTRKENYKKENHCMFGKKYKNNPNSKPIIQLSLNDEYIKEWASATEINDILGFHATNIGLCCRNGIKQSYGYKWKYV